MPKPIDFSPTTQEAEALALVLKIHTNHFADMTLDELKWNILHDGLTGPMRDVAIFFIRFIADLDDQIATRIPHQSRRSIMAGIALKY